MSVSITTPRAKPGCQNCIMRGLGLCAVLLDLGWEQPATGAQSAVAQNREPFKARQTIFQKDESVDCVPVICEGWAASVLLLSNGRRQILSVLLPGEMVSAGLLFERQLHCSIDTLSAGCYRNFDRSQIRNAMLYSPSTFDRMLMAYYHEKSQADQLIVDLGRRSAAERVARLLLNIWSRLDRLGVIENNTIEFPLRQLQIADATGLTNVYVNKVMGEFRDSGLIKLTDRTLQIPDIGKLQRLAQATK
jgi:CRP-like cAMP-binding protein